MGKFLKYTLYAVLASLFVFFAVSYLIEYRPEPVETVFEFGAPHSGDQTEAHSSGQTQHDSILDSQNADTLPDTLKIMSWNIGYAGLGDNMDFCVDGGEKVRDTKERTEKNLADIISCLKQEKADIYLLQEVDLKSHRTYRINEVETICAAFPDYHAYFAPNFKVWFVPSPLKEPIGQVHSGLLILTKTRPQAVRRIQYPSSFAFPVRMFNLKRCILEADYKTSAGNFIHICNTHNTAFDTGGMRKVEDDFIKERLCGFAGKGEGFIAAGDWNQCPPQYHPTDEELHNEFFRPEIFDTSGVSRVALIECDTVRRSMRYNDKPYEQGSSAESVLDFFLLSLRGMQVLDMHTIDLHFRSSDHNPVIMEAALLQNF